MEYQCNHIKDLIDNHLLDTRNIDGDEDTPVLHQLYRDENGYMAGGTPRRLRKELLEKLESYRRVNCAQ